MNIKVLIDDHIVFEKNIEEPKPPVVTGKAKDIFDGFDANRGVLEYNGIVAEIQKWYYDSSTVVKGPWCASSMSYFANKAGLLPAIGGKNDNVYNMMQSCKLAAKEGYGTFYTKDELPKRIPQYAICFFLWSGSAMTEGSSKHVCMSEYASSGANIYCIGGNQSDKICTKSYERSKLYGLYVLNS